MKDNSSLMQKIEKYTLIAGAVLTGLVFGERIYTDYKNNKSSTSVEQKVIEEKPKIQLENKIDEGLNPNSDGDFLNDSEATLLARAIYGEARGESYDTKVAIAQTILNRTGKNKWWGNTLHEVLLKPYQFSCFNKNDPNYPKLQNPLNYENPRVWNECYDVAEKVLNHKLEDQSMGATHYCTNDPSWTKKNQPLFTKGKTKFYKLAN